MYNKLFTKILDSSIWLESTTTRLVWITFLAVMDETGFVALTAPGNVANRARVTLEEAEEAIACLERPDRLSGNKDDDGRRIERVPGGWMVLNATKHRDLVTRAIIQEQTRKRVQTFRERKRTCNAVVTPSESESESESEKNVPSARDARRERFERFWAVYPRKEGKDAAWRVWLRRAPSDDLTAAIIAKVHEQRASAQWLKDGGQFIPQPRTYLTQGRWQDEIVSAAPSRSSPRLECHHEPKCCSPNWHLTVLARERGEVEAG